MIKVLIYNHVKQPALTRRPNVGNTTYWFRDPSISYQPKRPYPFSYQISVLDWQKCQCPRVMKWTRHFFYYYWPKGALKRTKVFGVDWINQQPNRYKEDRYSFYFQHDLIHYSKYFLLCVSNNQIPKHHNQQYFQIKTNYILSIFELKTHFF